MRVFLHFCVLCTTAVHAILDGTCLRKDPPPGALVLSPGSELVLTCSGHVTVDGVKVRNSSNTNQRVHPSGESQTTVNKIISTGVSMENEKLTADGALSQSDHPNSTVIRENRSLRHGDTGSKSSPTAHLVQSASVSSWLKAEETDSKSNFKEEEEEEKGGRVTRRIKSMSLWKWTLRTEGNRDRDAGEISWRTGAMLSVSSVRVTDSGTYTCYHRDRKRFSLKVIIAEPPEKPSLSCYKKSPSSKIRCRWMFQKPVTIKPQCSLLLSKSVTEEFQPVQCTYSSRPPLCWCALDHNDEELRMTHLVYLCVTSIAGNATSPLLHFKPLNIIKPDPPSNVSVQQVKGQQTRLKVTWSLPASWKPQDHFYDLNYKLKYRPFAFSIDHLQIHDVKGQRSFTITDALPGVEYLIQLRATEEYDGQWSDWSTPVYAASWTAPPPTTTMISVYDDTEHSGSGDAMADAPPTLTTDSAETTAMSHHLLWVCASFFLLAAALAAYLFRHKDRLKSKLQSLSIITQWSDPPQPPLSATAAPEVQALVTFGPPSSKDGEGGEEEDTEERENERLEVADFNNTTYFFP